MKFNGQLPFRTALNFGIAFMTLSPMAAAYDGLYQEYCSTENTGSSYSPFSSIYMSNGKCQHVCGDSYAFAIVQNEKCWCSNYIPAEQENTDQCKSSCPGYPSDLCGDEAKGLYGYIPLGKTPAGTAGASSAQPQSSSPPSSAPPSTPQHQSSTSTPPSSSIPQYSSSSVAAVSSSTTSTTHHHTPHAHTGAAHTTIKVITKSGSVVTRTVTSTPIVVQGGNAPDTTNFQRKGFSSGAVAGIVIGVLIGVAALVLAGFLLWRRKKYADVDGEAGGPSTRPKRAASVLSKTGLLARSGTGKERPQSMSETYDDNFIGGSSSVRHSMLFGAGATVEAVSPVSPLGGSQDNISGSSRRHSKPLVYDQRLNPSALFANAEANGSRASMQDQHDYSRPLGIANPDFRASFDSR